MKFDFWSDLPKALVSICKEAMTNEDEEYFRILQRSEEVYSQFIFLPIYRNSTKFTTVLTLILEIIRKVSTKQN